MGLSLESLDGSEPPEEALPLLVEAQGGRLYALGLRFCNSLWKTSTRRFRAACAR